MSCKKKKKSCKCKEACQCAGPVYGLRNLYRRYMYNYGWNYRFGGFGYGSSFNTYAPSNNYVYGAGFFI